MNEQPNTFCLGYSWKGKFYPASTNIWLSSGHRKTLKDQEDKPKKEQNKVIGNKSFPKHKPINRPKYNNEVRQGVAKKPEIKLAPVKDRKHEQEWRNSPDWFETCLRVCETGSFPDADMRKAAEKVPG